MTDLSPATPDESTEAPLVAPANPLAAWNTELNTALIGHPTVTEAMLIALLAGGNILLEGPPGVGKRLAARALAASFGARFVHAQCQAAFAQPPPGPTQALVMLLTGLEQASPAAQAALLEALQASDSQSESQQQAPAMLIASRNPLDPAGSVPLLEALLDRFLLAVPVPFPELEDETRMVREVGLSPTGDMLAIAAPQQLLSAEEVTLLQERRSAVKVDDSLVSYAVRLTRATRYNPHLSSGAGPRAGIALVRCAQARALLQGRDHVVAADVKTCAPAVLRHRVRLAMAQRLDGVALEQVLADQLDQVSAPRP